MKAPGERKSTSISKPSSGPAPTPQQTTTPAPTPALAPSSSPNPSTSTGNNINKLANDVSIVGRLQFTERLVFDGRIKGEIKSDGALAVQGQAIVEATVSVKTLLVEGKIIGDIFATESVRLGPSAVVIGDITTGNLIIEAKASFSGQAKIGSPTAA
ncbi:MAG: bactofilin family protein [Roseibacillus sp.]